MLQLLAANQIGKERAARLGMKYKMVQEALERLDVYTQCVTFNLVTFWYEARAQLRIRCLRK